jgi:hypothetical protein
LFDLLVARTDFPVAALESTLTVIARGLVERQEEFVDLALTRFGQSSDLEVVALYVTAA